MGFMTLEEMSAEVSLNMAGRTIAPGRLTLWMNFALYNLASYVVLDDLRETVDVVITEGETNYNMPAGIDMLGILDFEINGRKMAKMKRQYSEENVSAAPPTHFLRRKEQYVIWPEPDDDYVGTIEYIKCPDRFTVSTQTTTFSPNWDVALIMLATHHAHLSLGNLEDATSWLGRFLGYAGSRIKEEDISADIQKGGLNVAWSREDIVSTPDDVPY